MGIGSWDGNWDLGWELGFGMGAGMGAIPTMPFPVGYPHRAIPIVCQDGCQEPGWVLGCVLGGVPSRRAPWCHPLSPSHRPRLPGPLFQRVAVPGRRRWPQQQRHEPRRVLPAPLGTQLAPRGHRGRRGALPALHPPAPGQGRVLFFWVYRCLKFHVF